MRRLLCSPCSVRRPWISCTGTFDVNKCLSVHTRIRVHVHTGWIPLPSSRHHLTYDGCLQDKKENYQNCSVLCWVWQLYTMICRHIWAVLKDECWFRFSFWPNCNLKGPLFSAEFVCLSVCLWPALLPFNVDRFWWNLVTRTLLWSSLAASIMVQMAAEGPHDAFLKI